MLITAQTRDLKNGAVVTLRSLLPEDAESFWQHRYLTNTQSPYLSQYPEEMDKKEDLKRSLESFSQVKEDPMDFLLGAFDGTNLVGTVGVTKVSHCVKSRHRAELGISIEKDWQGQGLGRILMELSLKQARENGFLQMELGVYEGNTAAIRLYESCGFTEMGRVPRGFRYKDGSCQDEILMVRPLD